MCYWWFCNLRQNGVKRSNCDQVKDGRKRKTYTLTATLWVLSSFLCATYLGLEVGWYTTLALPWPAWNHTAAFFQCVTGSTWVTTHSWLSDNFYNITVTGSMIFNSECTTRNCFSTGLCPDLLGRSQRSPHSIARFGEGTLRAEEGHKENAGKGRGKLKGGGGKEGGSGLWFRTGTWLFATYSPVCNTLYCAD